MDKKCGGAGFGKNTCPKCASEETVWRGGSWDWEAKLCKECFAYMVKLKNDQAVRTAQKKHPPRIREMTLAQMVRIHEAESGSEMCAAASAKPVGIEYLSLSEHEAILGERINEGYEWTRKELNALESKLARALLILEFYAHPSNYIGNSIIKEDGSYYEGLPVRDDGGKEARELLAEINGK